MRRFSSATVLLLGGLYEVGADGFIGGGFAGDILGPAFYVMLPLLFFWLFIPVYSSMVLPPAWVIETLPRPAIQDIIRPQRRWLRVFAPVPGRPAWRDALRPLLWLIPFVGYLIVFLLVAAVIAEIV